MSRTYRRKNYYLENNTTWDREGKKFYGRLTEWDYEKPLWCARKVFRKKTKREVWKHLKYTQRDTHSGVNSAPAWYDHQFELRVRTHNKRELAKWIKNPDYEVMCVEKPIGANWYWF